ncbi:MAG: thioredoxin family protein [Thermoguttaceae bacterium]|nr:thioredoxin family protein [Thermoguttaceae bacterium]
MKPAYFTKLNKKYLAVVFLLAVGAAGVVGTVRGSKAGEKNAPAPQTERVETVRFLSSVEKGRARSAESGKPLLLFFTEPSSPFSQRVEKDFFADPQVAEVIGQFVCVSVDTGRTASIPLMKKYAVTAAPTVLLVPVDGEAAEPITRFRTPAEFKEQLKALLRPVAWQQASLYLR